MTSPGPRISAPTAAQRLRPIQQRWPAAAQLARVLSLAIRIEPSLLRAARLAVGLDAAAEADLWFSGLIVSSGTLGISFGSAVAEVLRRELAASPKERALAWKLVKEHHGQQPWSIRLEERINYLTTGPTDEASEIEDLLAAALSELHEVRARDEQAALGIARWLLAALARAPSAARATPTAAAAELAASVQLDGRLGGADQLAQAENSELLPWLLDHLGTTLLPVRLLPGAVAMGGDPPDGIPLPVPATDPLVVSVSWGSGADAHHEHVRLTPGEELLVPVEASEVELHTLTGGGVVLRRAGIGRILVNGVDQGAGFAVADYAILTAAHVLGDWALQSGPPNDPPGSFASEGPASEAPAVEAETSADAGSSVSGPAPDVIYIPEDGEPLNVRVVAADSELDVVLLKPERPAPAILPVGQIQPGQKCRLQVLPGRDQTGSRQDGGAPAVSVGGVSTSGGPHPLFTVAPVRGRGPSLPGQSGAAITLENPWGAVVGLLLAETTQVMKVVEIAEQLEAEEGLAALLRAAPIDAIVARFNLARQITPATAALVDGKWPATQPLENLLALPLRDGALPVLADIEPAELGLSPRPPALSIPSTLRSFLEASRSILFVGAVNPPSWAVYREVRADLPDARLLVPNARPGTLMSLATHPDLAAYPERVMVWLDDLPRYLDQTDDLDSPALSRFDSPALSRFLGQDRRMLIGTISQADLDPLGLNPLQPELLDRLFDEVVWVRPVEEEQHTESEASPDARPPGQGDEGRARAGADESERERWQRAAEAGNTDAMTNLGTLLAEQDPPDLDGARRWWVRAAEAGDTRAMTNLAALLEDSDPARARQLYEQAASAGDASAMTNLAFWLGRSGQVQEAIGQIRQLLDNQTRVLGPDHPDTLTTRGDLAFWLGRSGQVQEAIGQFRQLLDDQTRVLGPDHPDTLTTRSNLASFTGEAGDAAGAREQYAALLSIRERVSGPEHPDTLTTRHNLASFTGEAGDAAGARDQYAALLPVSERVLGPEHPDTLSTRASLAFWTGQTGDAAGARDQYAALLPVSERVLGPEDPSTLTIRRNLAEWTGRAGDAAEAEAPPKSLLIKTGEQSRIFHTDFTAGREGDFTVDDDFASAHHARFQVSRGRWYIEDLGSTNGTWLNGRRILAAQLVKKGDKIRIGRTDMIVEPLERPVVTGVSPGRGPVAGGTEVTVTGSGFTNATVVRFGQVAASAWAVASDTQLLVTSPPAGTAGPVDVTVTMGETPAISAVGQFTYVNGDTQEDPWQQFARTHQIGQVVPGRVAKLVPFGAFVRVEEGIEGLVHISELADRHVEIPEQVVQVGDEIFVKIIDIDLDRRRISLSLKQANEGTIGEAVGDDFDPTLYGMPAQYDEQGNYVYPEGFDSETGEWLEGYEAQREEWEQQYAEARSRFEAHRRQVTEARNKAAEDEAGDEGDTGGESGRGARRSPGPRSDAPSGALASNEALAALRDKLSGGQS